MNYTPLNLNIVLVAGLCLLVYVVIEGLDIIRTRANSKSRIRFLEEKLKLAEPGQRAYDITVKMLEATKDELQKVGNQLNDERVARSLAEREVLRLKQVLNSTFGSISNPLEIMPNTAAAAVAFDKIKSYTLGVSSNGNNIVNSVDTVTKADQ